MSESDSQYTKKAGITADKKISVIGYDETGRSHSMNLRDSGFDIIVGVRPGKSWERASKDGFKVYSISDAVEISDVISVTLPAAVISGVYPKFIKNSLSGDKCLIFSDAACLNFEIIEIPDCVSAVAIFTPKTGNNLREEYLLGRKIRSYAALYQKTDDNSMNIAQEYAEGLGSPGDHFFETKMSEIACAQIFAGTHLSDLLETVINSGIKALEKEISCSELSADIIAEALCSAADNMAEYKDPKDTHLKVNSLNKSEIEDGMKILMSEWVYKSKSGLTFKDLMLSEM